MSGDAIRLWRDSVNRELLLRAQDSMPTKHRPDRRDLELVGLYLAQSFVTNKGYVDETQTQVVEGLHGVLSVDQVKNALTALQNVDVLTVIRAGARGHGTRRVFSFHDPKQLSNPSGVNPPANGDEHSGAKTATQRGKRQTQRGKRVSQRGNPTTPEELPEQNLNLYPLPEREQVAAQLADIALRFDQERYGEITTVSLREKRRYEYRVKALEYLEHRPDPDASLPMYPLAAQLVAQRHGQPVSVPDLKELQDWERYEPNPVDYQPTCNACMDTGTVINPTNLHDTYPCPTCKGQP